MMRKAYFAGGCFWCITPMFKIYGAADVICGYAGGEAENPSYEQVKTQKTGHRETICVTYDPDVVSYETLLDIYLSNIDPFDSGGQFIDRGFSYTLAIFYGTPEERETAERAISLVEAEEHRKPSVEIIPFTNFYPAEDYHQDYYLKNPDAFARELIESGRKQGRE